MVIHVSHDPAAAAAAATKLVSEFVCSSVENGIHMREHIVRGGGKEDLQQQLSLKSPQHEDERENLSLFRGWLLLIRTSLQVRHVHSAWLNGDNYA
jgi:hypothetical protein